MIFKTYAKYTVCLLSLVDPKGISALITVHARMQMFPIGGSIRIACYPHHIETS